MIGGLMKTKAIILIILLLFLYSQLACALEITYPTEGETLTAGSQLNIIVKPALGEKWETVLLGIYPMSYDSIKNEYSYTLTIPKNLSGYITDTIVIAADGTGKVVELKRNFFVQMPPDVVLQGIVAGGSGGGRLVVLEKMPLDSSAVDIENFEREQLSVHGRYSDNVNRELTSSASGTTYTSSDETIVKVDAEGKVTAQGIGRAKITVRNGNYSATVDIIVKPYKK